MSSVALDANVTIKKNKTLKKEYQHGDSLVYKDYVAPGPTGDIVIEQVSFGTDSSYNAHLGLTGTAPSVILGHITGSSGSYGNSILKLERDKLAFQVPTANSLGSLDYGTSGHVLTSGGSSSAMSWAAPSIAAGANNTFTGTNTFEDNLVVEDGSSNPEFTFNKDGRIGIGSSVNYGNSGQVLTSGGSGAVSWTTPTSGGAQLLNSTTLTAYHYGTLSDSINFYPKTVFHNPVEFNGKVPGYRIGAVTGEGSTSMFTSGGISNTRLEVDDGNFVVKGNNTVTSGDSSVTHKNAVYSDEYKNLAGEKIIVPSTTAFDPTKEDRTGSMASIRDYIGTFIDIVPPVFAGGRFASGASNTATGTVGSTFNPFTYSSPNVTCTDSPTAGPNKGTTQTISLGADHFEFRNATTSSGVVVPGTTVVPIGNVFDNLTGPIYRYSTTLSGSGVNVLGTNLNGFKLKWDADGGFYFRLTTDSSAGIGNIAFLYTNSTTGNWAYPNVNIAGDSTRILFMLGTAFSAYLQAKYTYSFSASTEYELYITWQAMSHTDTSAPDDSDIIFGIRPTGGTWSTGAGTALNDTSEMFTGSGLSSEYFKLEGNESSSLLALNWNGASGPSTGSMQEARLYNRYITETILNEPIGNWQASSTWKTAGTYYLRYKATDAAGNDTPNDADHYLTVTVSAPSPIYTRTTTAGHSTTIAANTYGAWKGWNATEDWTMVMTFTWNFSSNSSYAVPFKWTPTGCKIEFEMHQTQLKLNWETNTSVNQERLQLKLGTLSNGTTYSLAITYDSTGYNAGPGTIPDLSNGAQSSSSPLKFYLKAAGQGSGTYTLPSLSDVSDAWDNSHTRTFPPGDGSTAILCPGSGNYSGGSSPVSYVAFYNATISESQLNSDH